MLISMGAGRARILWSNMASFDEIQRALVPLWRSLASLNQDDQTIVVVPSISFWVPPEIAPLLPAYEERYLFLLFLLRQPRARLVYVTSRPVPPPFVDYYLGLLPGVIPSHARGRLHLVAASDDSPVPLTRKILDRPEVLDRIRALVPDPARAHIVPFVTSDLERELVERLGIPMYGSDPRLTTLGTKSSGRRLFAEAGVAMPAGTEDVRSLEDVVSAVEKLRAGRPGLRAVMVKLNEGVGGLGNAIVELGPSTEAEEAVRTMRMPEGTFESFFRLLAEQGGVVEERIEGAEIRSPSVQLRGTPLGELEVLSTHDQLLGGADGQLYLGCRFPADGAYATAITRDAVKIGERLIANGVIGRFAIDFVVVRSGDTWEPSAIELNLRKGGTTHPYLTLQFLTDGTYDAASATFVAPNGDSKYFVATDHAANPAYAKLSADDVFDAVVRHGLHFDLARQTGVVLHMLSALPHGRLGLTAVANSPAEADALYEHAVATFDEEAARR